MEGFGDLISTYGFPTAIAVVFIYLYTKSQDKLVQAYVDSLQKNTDALNRNADVLDRVLRALERE